MTATDARRGRRAELWGRAAEELAAAAYQARGGRILGRRVRTQGGEIDLVVALEDLIVFAEVKARKSMNSALSAASGRDWRRRGAAAEAYMAETGRQGDYRLDLAAVDGAGRIQIVENAGMAVDF